MGAAREDGGQPGEIGQYYKSEISLYFSFGLGYCEAVRFGLTVRVEHGGSPVLNQKLNF